MRRCQALLPLGLQALRCGPEAAVCWAGSASGSASGSRRSVTTATESLARAPPAFVFDIDGVLVRGRHTLPEAKRALAKLYAPDGSHPLYPVAFLTNGGGVTERMRAHQLSERLGVNVVESQVVLSHTPFRQLAPKYADMPVLVAGRGQVREVAHHYGFRHVITTQQLARAMPAAVPFHEDQGLFPGGDLPCYTRELKYGSRQHPIRAIFVMTDPSDWYRDLQLMTDVLLSRGVPGQEPAPDALPVDVFFSNPDLLWSNEFATPRFGQGAYATCLEALFKQVTGEPLRATHYGKPNPEPYRLIEQLLVRQAQQLGIELPEGSAVAAAAETAAGTAAADGGSSGGSGSSGGNTPQLPVPFSAIFAIGDNPAADVRGANAAGSPWTSVLVTKTGVARANCSTDPAQIVVDHVEAAVDAALHRSRSSLWHSMR